MDDKYFINFSNKIKWLNFFFTITVVAMHCVRVWEMYYGMSNSVISNIYVELESKAMTFFFFMSGFWFFSKYMNSSYFGTIEKKIHSIIIPYIFWAALKIIIVQLWSFISTKQFKYSLLECVKGLLFVRIGSLNLDPLNGPLWYLIRIMSYFIVSPILYYLIKDEFSGVISLFVLRMISASYGYYTFGGWLFVFCFGAYIGLHYRDKLIRMANKVKGISMTLILVLYFIFVHYSDYIGSFTPIKMFDSAFEIIIILCMIIFSKNPSYGMKHSNYSFLLYCSHIIWIPFLVKIVHSVVGNTLDEGICQSIVLLICCFVVAIMYLLLRKFTPKIYRVLVGGR